MHFGVFQIFQENVVGIPLTNYANGMIVKAFAVEFHPRAFRQTQKGSDADTAVSVRNDLNSRRIFG